jgi:hypothetical protein
MRLRAPTPTRVATPARVVTPAREALRHPPMPGSNA